MVAERPRLVIWDLDETFWRGTVTEGGITFLPEHRDLVIELARRGIVSSICSKNDHETIKKILIEHEVWDYFVLPSISWEPKGPRIAALIETIGLRPPTVLFIDDNPLNLEEAKRFVPGIQTHSHTFIPQMRDDEQFRGKDDGSLSRLKQYKVLEKRKADETAAGADLTSFLRESDIQVRLEFDIEPHIDRFIELINRTNQLNFTKARLPEDAAEARSQALQMLSNKYYIQAALIHVRDRYGDHGFCGVYVHNSEARKLEHLAFSCRILGMGVERWLYQKLKRPHIDVRGEVIADLFDPSPVDWITQVSGDVQPNAPARRDFSTGFQRIIGHGSCDVGAVTHYFAATAPNVTGEYFFVRGGGRIWIDHSMFLRHAIDGLSEDALAAAGRIGYIPSDFQTRLFDRCSGDQLVLLSVGNDHTLNLYRHRATGMTLPFPVTVERGMEGDLRALAKADIPPSVPKWAVAAMDVLREEFDFVGPIHEKEFKENLGKTLAHISRPCRVFVLNFIGSAFVNADGSQRPPPQRQVEMNRWIEETCGSHPDVEIVNVAETIKKISELNDPRHFDRIVYFRIYQTIVDRLDKTPAAARIPELAMA